MVSGIVLPPQRIVNGRSKITATVGPAESTVLETGAVATHEDRKNAEHAVKKQESCVRGSTRRTQDLCLISLVWDTWHPTVRTVIGGVIHLGAVLLNAL
jgi:hypothetical protein